MILNTVILNTVNSNSSQNLSVLLGTFICLIFLGCSNGTKEKFSNALKPESDGAYHVRPGEDIQAAIEAAAADSKNKVVKVHEGTYFPTRPGQAFIWLNREHDGVQLKAVGKVVLTAANEKVALVTSRSYPAIVNHVVYFGHGITSKTTIDGFEITGANGHMTEMSVEKIEPQLPETLEPTLFFYSDGGAVKIYGDSCPQLFNLEIVENTVRICGGGVSVDQRGLCKTPVRIENCRFINNRCPATGSAIDVLQDSKAEIVNCLFVGNIGNYGMEEIAKTFRLSYNDEHGCGALTVFPKSTAKVDRCTFTENWSGVDDKGVGSEYKNCIFWKNDKSDGSRTGDPYELDVNETSTVTGCFAFGKIIDLKKTIDASKNNFDEVDPQFDSSYVPQSKAHENVGFRPKNQDKG